MLTADNPKELRSIVNIIVGKAIYKRITPSDNITITGIKIGSTGNADSKYAWTHYHETIRYKNTFLDVKAPTIIGRAIIEARYIDEKVFNQGFIERESAQESLAREIEIYKKLKENGFASFEQFNEFFPEIKEVLLTRKIIGAAHTIDLLQESRPETQKIYVSQITSLMRQAHDMGVIWGDAWFGNSMYTDGAPIIYDFGFKPNPKKSEGFLRGKDLVSLCRSATYRTNQPAERIVPHLIETYDPDRTVRDSIRQFMYEKETDDINRSILRKIIEEKLYFNTVFGMDRKGIEKVNEQILKSL